MLELPVLLIKIELLQEVIRSISLSHPKYFIWICESDPNNNKSKTITMESNAKDLWVNSDPVQLDRLCLKSATLHLFPEGQNSALVHHYSCQFYRYFLQCFILPCYYKPSNKYFNLMNFEAFVISKVLQSSLRAVGQLRTSSLPLSNLKCTPSVCWFNFLFEKRCLCSHWFWSISMTEQAAICWAALLFGVHFR